MTRISDKTVLITGGASGIGLLMAKICLQKNAERVILLDLDSEALNRAKNEFQEHAAKLHFLKVDITDEAQLDEALLKLQSLGVEVDILINNAGVVTGKSFIEHTSKDIELNMQVNSIAPMKLSLKLLPGMVSRGSAHIVNISSAASMLSNPGMSVYCASKWALTGWSDSLRLEMQRKKTGVKVLTVTPYYIDTGMFSGVRSPVIPILKPDKVAHKIIKAIEVDKIVLRTPKIVYALPLIKGILPKRWFDIVVGKYFGIYDSMNKFKGRSHE